MDRRCARGRWALFTSSSKSFNVPALTGAYGFIIDESDREACFHALKSADPHIRSFSEGTLKQALN
ncbi:hypothetical protein ACC771_26380, partial [Rhizobium ruizarguesonis]